MLAAGAAPSVSALAEETSFLATGVRQDACSAVSSEGTVLGSDDTVTDS
jgi:hypothetical protein